MSTNRRRDPADSLVWETWLLATRRVRDAAHAGESPVSVLNTGDAVPVGRFHYAALLRDRTQVLTTWRVSSDDPLVLGRVVGRLGGGSRRQDMYRNTGDVITETAEAEIVLHGPGALRLRWRRDSRSCCDGRVQVRHDQGALQPCTCPPSLPERRAATRHGYGCEPQVEVFFRLTGDPALGVFTFASGSWAFAEDAIRVIEALQRSSGPACARLDLHRTHYTLASGRIISCTKPRLTIHTPAEQQPLVGA